jgi:hypothetical protein
MAFCRCRTWIEVLGDEFLTDVGTPFEETASSRSKEGGYFGVAQ